MRLPSGRFRGQGEPRDAFRQRSGSGTRAARGRCGELLVRRDAPRLAPTPAAPAVAGVSRAPVGPGERGDLCRTRTGDPLLTMDAGVSGQDLAVLSSLAFLGLLGPGET